MVRQFARLPQELADEHTLLAQKYAGALVGHPYRNVQQTPLVTVDRSRRWKELSVVADDCIFCVRLTDEEAIRRVAGYQHQLDIESTRSKMMHFAAWHAGGAAEGVPEPDEERSVANLRRFVELFQDMPTEKRPIGWRLRPLPFITLPLRLKRKLCVEWNHCYLKWMTQEGVQYDFETREFYREVSEASDPIESD
jgi:hypothetical protein